MCSCYFPDTSQLHDTSGELTVKPVRFKIAAIKKKRKVKEARRDADLLAW